MRRAVQHPLAPTLAAAAIGIAYLLAAPATADMAAHTFRAWLWDQAGFTAWNGRWYGGHHIPGYSLLFPPLSALVDPRLVGTLAGVAAVALFTPLARGVAPTLGVGTAAAWLFMGGAMSNVVIGRMPFTLGLALGVGAWACARRPSPAWQAGAALLSLACVSASPVAGLFLAVGAVALVAREGAPLTGARPRHLGAAAVLALPAVAGGLAQAWLFPEGGTDHFVAPAFWPMLLACAAGLALVDPRWRGLLLAGAVYLAVLVAAFALPTPLGQNALRPGAILGPPLLVLAARQRASLRMGVLAVGAVLLYLQWLPAVRAVAEARGDRSTSPAYHVEVERFLRSHARPGERLEVPLTHNHWEAAYLARVIPLARGWHRQLDRKVNPVFYEPGPLRPARYEAWLRRNAVRWVALPDVPLDFSAREEAKLLRRDPPFLRLVHGSARWRVWEVRGVRRPASGDARVTQVRLDGFDLDVPRPGSVVVRQRYTPYFTLAGAQGCVRRAPGGWTEVRLEQAGRAWVHARFSMARALRPARPCRS